VVGIRHTPQIVGANDANKQISTTAYNVDHAKGNIVDALLDYLNLYEYILDFDGTNFLAHNMQHQLISNNTD
jgi:hypothetical protein